MSRIFRFINFLWLISLILIRPSYANKAERLVVIGGTLTEIVFSLGAGESVVGVDATSVYPTATKDIKNLGYRQGISLEGVLSLKPNLVLASSKLTPKELIKQLKDLGVKTVVVKEDDSFESAKEKIKEIAEVLSKNKEGIQLLEKLQNDLNSIEENEKLANLKVLFVYARGGNRVFLSGKETSAHEMIKLSGAKNAFSSVVGFRPITTEALVKGNPDVIVMLKSGEASLKTAENSIWSLPGVAMTTAGKNKNLILVDDLSFMGFGPRSANELLKFKKSLLSL